ncbi:hypothetical protein [Granulicella sp. WH15]|uniref:hypothetical protein n=1 Tax=Granulicella sp. WH15 TaxID=2602070 RepID=UPI002106CBF5|nr:hypothetical protein [Granulicella sp. WH15]
MLLCSSALAADKPRPAPAVKPAAQYAVHEAHPDEHVTIAAEPCEDPDNCKFFRLPYIQHGFLPVRVIITNDRDQPLKLDDVRIQFFPAEGDKMPAATDEDINRRLFSRKSAAGTKIPLVPITIHHEPVDKKITNDGDDFGFKSLTVAPHTTAAGYVFYDVRALDEPVLKGAELYVKMIRTTSNKGEQVELFGFSIPFTRRLDPKPEVKPSSQSPSPK